jgi:pantothenate kinase-related protein Tda10
MMPTLCVTTGPVGAGKSTTSIALPALLRERGRHLAVVHLDQVYCASMEAP